MNKKKNSKKINLEVSIGKLKLKNPVIAASGTFGYGEEMAGFFDIKKLGAIVTKTITMRPREGNPAPRVTETASGLLNSIGLENKGLNDFVYNKVPMLEKLGVPVIVSIAGESADEFSKLAEELSKQKVVSAIELNLSCPNVGHKVKGQRYKLIAQDKAATGRVVSEVRKRTNKVLITKLSPNVTDIYDIAKAAERSGSDAISAINTLFGLCVNLNSRQPALGNITGGLSGPAIKPVALNFVREICSCVKIPVIGVGGIMTAGDALEFIICGAKAIQVGTANFIDPFATIEILDGVKEYMKNNKIDDIMSLTGSLNVQKKR